MFSVFTKVPLSRKFFFSSSLKNLHHSPLYDIQKKLNPTLAPFGNYNLPLTFPKHPTAEVVKKTRKPGYCTIFDVSQMNRLELSLPNKLALTHPDNILSVFLEKLFPLNTRTLQENKSQLSVVLNEKCQVQDDFIISNIDNEKYRFIVNANTTQDFVETLTPNLPTEAILEKKESVILAIQGPNSQLFLEKMLDTDLHDLYFMENRTLPYLNSTIEISRCGYTGEDGFELYMKPQVGENIYEKILLRTTEDKNILLGGLLERDILRLEAGLCLSGNEFGKELDIHFQNSNLDFIIGKRRRRELNFRGATNLHTKSLKNLIRCGFTCHRPIRPGKIYYQDLEVGFITSGVKSYNLDTFIGMGYLNQDLTGYDNNEILYLKVRGKNVEIEKHKLPFINNNYYKK